MGKFELSPNNDKIILHNLSPKMEIQIIFNDEDKFDMHNDVYEFCEFRGEKIIIVVRWLPENYAIEQREDYIYLQSILRRAWAWYRSQSCIDKYTSPDRECENGRFILQKTENEPDSWIVTDKKNLISILFKNHLFNETQTIVGLKDFSPQKIAILPRELQEVANWVEKNHYEKFYYWDGKAQSHKNCFWRKFAYIWRIEII